MRKFLWIFVALGPSPLMLFLSGNLLRHGANSTGVAVVYFVIAPIASLAGAIGLLHNPRTHIAATIFLGLVLGFAFYALNVGIGLLGGCALLTSGDRI